MRYRADEAKTIIDKLDYAMDTMSKAIKSEEKLATKRAKVFENPKQWEHPELLLSFSED